MASGLHEQEVQIIIMIRKSRTDPTLLVKKEEMMNAAYKYTVLGNIND
jgi:hypothetical protein